MIAHKSTRSGAFVIVDVSDPSFCPGKVTPIGFTTGGGSGTWFFMPCDWADPLAGYGTTIANRRGHPMPYSQAYETAEEALAAAEEWECGEPERRAQEARAVAARVVFANTMP
jgi:hypothetical protein